VVVARRHPEDAPSRLGMSVRAGALGAVGRNRIRRRLRAAFLVSAPPGYDVIVQAGPGVAEQDYQELAKAMKRGLNRAVKG
jgi:ribonuclease P protein component